MSMHTIRLCKCLVRSISCHPFTVLPIRKNLFSTRVASFDEAKAALNALKNEPDNEVKLQIYALYKQATFGDCTDAKPSSLNFVQKAKWQAWTALKSMPKEEAVSKYIMMITDLLAKETPKVNATSPTLSQVPGLESSIDDKGVMHLRLNRPEKKNAITREMYEGWIQSMDAASNDPNIKLVTVTGTGDYFSSGNDLGSTIKPVQDGQPMEIVAKLGRELLHRFVNTFINFPKPLIGLINGPAIGISVTTLGLYDHVLASDNATFQTPFVTTGQTPEGCSSYTFPRILGPMMANDMLLFGRKLTATEACSFGLVNRVVPQAEFSEECNKFLSTVAALPSDTLRLSKQILRIRDREILMSVNALECDQLMERWTSPEFIQAATAFLQRKR